MKPRTGSDIEIEIGMMHTVQSPEQGYSMEHDMLQVNGHIQHDYRYHQGHGGVYLDLVEQSPLRQLCISGDADGSDREYHAQ